MKNNHLDLDDKQLFISVIKEFEGRTGSELFGITENGCNREFYCLSPSEWIWKQEWIDKDDRKRTNITRYRIESSRIIKTIDGESYNLVGVNEAKNLLLAAQKYSLAVKTKLYFPLLNYL